VTTRPATGQPRQTQLSDQAAGLFEHHGDDALKQCPRCGFRPDDISDLVKRVVCCECGEIRVHNYRSPYAVCPNGHGKLVRRFSQAEERRAIAAVLPEARLVGHRRFTIEGHDGLFAYRNGSGHKPARPGDTVGPDQVIARHETTAGRLIRVFSRISRDSTKGKQNGQTKAAD